MVMTREKILKDRFHEARARKGDAPNYTPEMLRALCDMAKADVYPDGTFSDEDCVVWSMFHIG